MARVGFPSIRRHLRPLLLALVVVWSGFWSMSAGWRMRAQCSGEHSAHACARSCAVFDCDDTPRAHTRQEVQGKYMYLGTGTSTVSQATSHGKHRRVVVVTVQRQMPASAVYVRVRVRVRLHVMSCHEYDHIRIMYLEVRYVRIAENVAMCNICVPVPVHVGTKNILNKSFLQ
jgi:hypothetical protein